MKIQIKKTRPDATLPVYASELAAGADLCACITDEVRILPGALKIHRPAGIGET